CRDPFGALAPFVHAEQAGHALDHHLAHVAFGLADERDAGGWIGRLLAHPFGTGARLAGAAPAEDQPGGPGVPALRAFQRALVEMDETPTPGLSEALLIAEWQCQNR